MRIKMVRGKGVGIILAVALAALLLFTACAPAPNVEKAKVVEIGAIAPLTGSAASMMQGGVRNVDDLLRYAEEVGIPGVTLPPGVTIKVIWVDDALEVSRALSHYQRFVDRGVPFLFLYSPTTAEPLKARCERDQMPALAFGITDALLYPPGWIYTYIPTESEEFAIVADWIMGNWQEERSPTLAFIGPDSAYGRAAEAQGAKYAESIGIEILPMEFAPYTPLDLTPQLLRLQNEGADFVYLSTIYTAAVAIMRDAERMGLIGKIRFGGYEGTQSIELMQTLGPAVEGYFAPRHALWYKDPSVLPFEMDMWGRYEGGMIDTHGDYPNQMTFMPAVIEAIRRAIENVGFENLDGPAVKEAMDTIQDWDPMGTGRPVTWTDPNDRRGCALTRIYQVQGGEVIPLTDWQEAPMLIPGE
jgi:branched-chain amino acid transport system substrate-binding protein